MAAAPAIAEVKAGVDAWTAGDFATAVREWAGPAAEGDPDAQFNMGQAYRLGRGVETDVAQAEALYARAAAQGHVKAAGELWAFFAAAIRVLVAAPNGLQRV